VADPEKLESYKRLYRDMRATWSRNYQLPYAHFGTVGAVALDMHGNVAAAVSTGGRWFKIHGRIGDSAVIGAGIYADNDSGAVCATGHGELMIRLCLSKYACDLLKGNNPCQSAKKAIGLLTQKFGANTGAIIIAIDTKGQFGMSTNTKSMPVAMKSSKDEKTRIFF
jgi:beta-aspartyl-peptidase (threonine type)